MGGGQRSGNRGLRCLVALGVLALTGSSMVTRQIPASSAALPPLGSGAPLAQVLAAGTGGCIVSPVDMLGWWPGENELTGAVGPALSGTAGYTDAVVGQGFVLHGGAPLTSSTLPSVSTGVSVDAWVRPEPGGTVQAIFSRWTWVGGDTDDAFLLMLSPSGDLWWATDDTSTRSPLPATAHVPQIFDGQFHHVAATWDSDDTVVYLDGIPVGSRPSTGGIINPAAATQFALGGSPSGGTPMAFDGVVDEATVYDRALTPAEVAAIHDAGAAGKCPPQSPSGTPTEVTGTTGVGGDALGWAVATSGSTLVVGSPGGRRGLTGQGVVTVFVRDGTNWVQQAEIVASDPVAGAQFGQSVALSGDTLVVGAPLDRPTPAAFQGGSAYVFTRSGTAWTQQAKLVSAQPSFQGNFAGSVAVNGDTAVIGSARNERAAYVFTRTGSTWAQQARLVDPSPDPAVQFGTSVSVRGDTVAVGAVDLSPDVTPKGAAFVFQRTGITWAQQARLAPAFQQLGDRFGLSVALEGDLVLVGAPLADTPLVDSGRVDAFGRTGTAWAALGSLTPNEPSTGSRFGTAVALQLGTALVGAPLDDTGALDAGAAYVFTANGATWSQLAKLQAPAPLPNDQFGFSVAANSVAAAAGAPGRDPLGVDSGAAYVFNLF